MCSRVFPPLSILVLVFHLNLHWFSRQRSYLSPFCVSAYRRSLVATSVFLRVSRRQFSSFPPHAIRYCICQLVLFLPLPSITVLLFIPGLACHRNCDLLDLPSIVYTFSSASPPDTNGNLWVIVTTVHIATTRHVCLDKVADGARFGHSKS